MLNRFHKIRNWEYWPVYVVYTPAFIYWVGQAIRFRSATFYRWVNPAIPNGGLHGDSKKEIYDLLPQWSFPKTTLVRKEQAFDSKHILQEMGLQFPVLLKPDIGCRGVDVKRVNSHEEIREYHQASEKDYLIQEWIDLPNELGLFYCKIPGEKRGRITGITLKSFLTVTGDGRSSIKDLLQKDPRSRMQIEKLEKTIDLNVILPLNENKCMVPYGNHNRGTQFINGNQFITSALEKYFENLLGSIPGFHYGRLDIRYNTLEELEQGLNFKIIELNGAKSEPTHIYDTSTSFWKGQREIFRHLQLFMCIVEKNRI
ncbi:MAG: hypothetical protein RL204_768 [Bacteroidota bacterium]